MLKTIFVNIFIALFITGTLYSQSIGENNPATDTLKTKDSLIQSSPIDSVIESVADTIKITETKTAKPDTVKLVKTIPDKIEQTLLENLHLNPINIIESINFWTFLQLFIWVFIGTGLIKLINKIAKSRFAVKKIPFFFSILSLLKIIVWFSVFYIILFWVLNIPQNILWILLLIVFVILGISTIPFFKNIVGGFYISISSLIETGNNIVIKGFEGRVIDVNWRSVKILTEENNEISLPNSIFLFNPVTNISFGKKERLIVLEYSFPFQLESTEILKLLKEAALSSPYIFNGFEPKAYLIKADFVNKINTYEINIYIIDVKFENEFKNLFNTIILNSLGKNGNE